MYSTTMEEGEKQTRMILMNDVIGLKVGENSASLSYFLEQIARFEVGAITKA